MRTTLTLEDEVAAGIKRIQKKHPEKSFKDIVNQVMRTGLAVAGERVRVPFKIMTVQNARPKPGINFDSISSLISIAEGDFHK